MAIEHFTKAAFEAALPRHKGTARNLWLPLGVIDGEYTYLIPVTDHAGILIRSSVKSNGISAAAGEDSIRILLVRSADRKVFGSKLQKYTTRLPGWQERMIRQLRAMWPMAKMTGPCIRCPGWVGIYKCRREGENKGRMFRKCTGEKCDFFEWVNLGKSIGTEAS